MEIDPLPSLRRSSFGRTLINCVATLEAGQPDQPKPDRVPTRPIRAAVVGKFASGASHSAAELLRATSAVDAAATTDTIEALAGELVTAGKVERLWGNTPARWRKKGNWKA
jgi:hypothetical protein